MVTGKTARKSAGNLTLDKLFQCYVIVGLFSTSGVDVLLGVTLMFLLFVSLRQSLRSARRISVSF